jgi:hypothetical protein
MREKGAFFLRKEWSPYAKAKEETVF